MGDVIGLLSDRLRETFAICTEEQSDSGAGLEGQRRAIAAECERRSWQLLEVIEDAGFSAKDLKRPGIKEALRVLEEGDAKALRSRRRCALSCDTPSRR